MNQKIKNSLIFLLVLAVMLCLGQGVCSAVAPGDADQGLMTRITSISEKRLGHAQAVIIQGNGRIPGYTARTTATPPRIVIDIPFDAPSFKSMARPVSFPGVSGVRVGCHPGTVRLVLDLEGTDIPTFVVIPKGDVLIITLNTGAVDAGDPNLSTVQDRPETAQKQDSEIDRHREELFNAEAQLIRLDGSGAPTAYYSGIDAYASGNWSAAIQSLSRFLAASPQGPYVEKAYFLTAKAYDRLHGRAAGIHYSATKQRYEDAIYRYPQSVYVTDAYYSIGELCFREEMAVQALGYCNLVINIGKEDHATLKAMMLKAKLLTAAHRMAEALDIYQRVQQQYPDLDEGVRAKIETAKLLFTMNRFEQSLDVLNELVQKGEYVSRYPDISRCLGDNYYQLGDFARARQHLLRYYNVTPYETDSHLVLARIADAYREEGQIEAAGKFYRLVVERYPDTEGAMISMYRIAEQQEKGETKADKGVGSGFKVVGSSVGMPREIYEKVVQSALEKDEASPLTQYALLKLSILDLKEKQYGRSVEGLKHLMEAYPHTRLQKEISQAFEGALLGILEENYQVKKYKRIVNTYQAEKKNIVNCTSPRLFIIVARSARHLELDGLAKEMFKTADGYLPDREKPADLLFYLAKDLAGKGEPQAALAYVDLLIENHPEDPYASDGYVLKGTMLSLLKTYGQAAKMFSAALNIADGACDQTAILIQKAKALSAGGWNDAAHQTLVTADKTLKGCESVDQDILAEIGGLYLQCGYPEEALAFIQSRRGADTQGRHGPRLQLLMARCYEKLNNKELYVSIYGEVANQNDPFWGRVAKEKMDEMSFNAVMQKEM